MALFPSRIFLEFAWKNGNSPPPPPNSNFRRDKLMDGCLFLFFQGARGYSDPSSLGRCGYRLRQDRRRMCFVTFAAQDSSRSGNKPILFRGTKLHSPALILFCLFVILFVLV